MKIFLSIFYILSFSISINAQDLSIKQTEQFFGVEMVKDKKVVIGGYMNVIDSSHIKIDFDLGENWKTFDSISTYLELESTCFDDIYFLFDKQLKDSIPCLVFRNSEGFSFYISQSNEHIYYRR